MNETTKKKLPVPVILEEIEPRTLWKDEARDFTPWLRNEGLELIGRVLGFKLDNAQSEVKGSQSKRRCDIVATVCNEEDEDEAPEKVVIENQLEKTDFSHLGRALLYAQQNDAKHIIWIVSDATSDHIKTIEWLNKNTTAELSFYLLRIDTYKIDDSRSAAFLTLIEGPDTEEKVEKSGTATQRKYLNFWKAFLAYADENKDMLSCIGSFPKPYRQNWYEIRIGGGNCHVNLCCSDGKVRFEFVAEKHEAFQRLHAIQDNLDSIAGVSSSDIVVKPDLKYKKICYTGPSYNDKSNESLTEAFKWLVDKIAALTPIAQKALGIDT